MPHKNQMLGLMKLALDRTSNTINLIFHYAVGAAIFCAIFTITSVIQFVNLRTWVNYALPSGAIDINGALLVAGFYGFINTIYLLFLLAIYIILAVYTLNFTLLCYYYDNKEWECVKLAKRVNAAIESRFDGIVSNSEEATKQRREKRSREFAEAISQLKNDDKL
jgi:hypothetical protein